jgi:hypothetical protein
MIVNAFVVQHSYATIRNRASYLVISATSTRPHALPTPEIRQTAYRRMSENIADLDYDNARAIAPSAPVQVRKWSGVFWRAP